MRLFAGIALPTPIRSSLDQLIRSLKPAARVKWSRAANLHVTTKFIGEWPPDRLDELRAALREVPFAAAIPVAVRGLNWFPNERAPRVFFAGIEAPASLRELARRTDERLARLGVPVERRRYSPHLTLARIKEPRDLDGLRRAVEGIGSLDFGEFQADRFHLYLSEPRADGPVYTSLDECVAGPPEENA